MYFPIQQETKTNVTEEFDAVTKYFSASNKKTKTVMIEGFDAVTKYFSSSNKKLKLLW